MFQAVTPLPQCINSQPIVCKHWLLPIMHFTDLDLGLQAGVQDDLANILAIMHLLHGLANLKQNTKKYFYIFENLNQLNITFGDMCTDRYLHESVNIDISITLTTEVSSLLADGLTLLDTEWWQSLGVTFSWEQKGDFQKRLWAFKSKHS